MSNRTDFNFFDISKLRLELMGVGTLLILLCHSVGNNVKMSVFLAKIADNGQIGVDLFLFLSGLGLCLSLFLMFLCNDYVDGCLKYVSIAFRRVPSFILGMAIAAEVMNKRKISLFKILGLSFVPFVLISIYFPFVYCRWLIIIPLIVLLCSLISVSNRGTRLLSFMGMISIESYLANIFIGDILNHKSWIICGIDLSYGHYLEYFTVLFLGILIAYCVNSFVKQKNK